MRMEFTRRGRLPETGCFVRAKIGFAMAACWLLPTQRTVPALEFVEKDVEVLGQD